MSQSPSDPVNSTPLPDSPTWSHCEGLIQAFEHAWRQGLAPAIRDYLRADGPDRRALLVELVHVDLEFRLKSGDSARVESYLRDFPELAGDRPVTLELIAAEYGLRRRHRDDVTLDEYRRRFPEYLEELLGRLAGADDDTVAPAGKAPPADSAERPAVPGYEVVEQLGRGGMGVVFKAHDANLARHVALKFLPAEYARDPERLERFRREARTASALNHPHICTVHALDEHAGRPFIVMEFIDGLTLRALVRRRPAVEEVARLVGQAAQALAAAHAAGVVHRDVKPENIMARADGYVKVLDFGLARRPPAAAEPSPPGRDTHPGTFLGTAAYMSPEQARGQPADSASDVFSLGIVLYELTTGRHPFEADSAIGTLLAIGSAHPVPPSRLSPEVPAALDGLVEAMLHKQAPLRPTAAEVAATLAAVAEGAARRPDQAAAPRPLVRRERELAFLRAALDEADAGRGSLVCVAGEPGIGKTTLVEDFLAELAVPGRPMLVARGQCSERLAGTEAYLPVIDALGDLLRGEKGGSAARLMKVVAPTWYAQIAPAAPSPTDISRAPSQPAMLREFCNFAQEIARLGTLILFFDDVHWADGSTVDLLGHLGRHCPTLRVLVIVTYRPTELLLGPHPFHRVRLELQGKGACTELALGFLNRTDVDRYLALAFPGHAFPADFAGLIHARTEGSPLFMTDLLRYLRERGVLAPSPLPLSPEGRGEEDKAPRPPGERGRGEGAGGRWTLARELPDLHRELPESVRGVIQRQLERLGEADRRLLAAAAVQGPEFDSAVVAGALALDPAEVEDRLQVLDRVHGLVRLVRELEFPDRTLTQRYVFVHVLYQQALYTELSPSRRAALAAALARALEARHGEQGPEAAAALACLYEVGRDFARAARQCYRAAKNAARVYAHQEAAELSRRGLRLLKGLPDTLERAGLELPLQTMLGLQLQVTQGYAAPEATRAYSRARELCQRGSGGTPPFPVLWGLWLSCKVRSELAKALVLAEELGALARQLNDADLVLQAQQALSVTTLCRGEPAATLRHMERGVALYDPERHRMASHQFGQDPGVACKAFGAVALWLLGRPDEAVRLSGEAVRLSHELWQPSSQALALHFAAMLHQLRRDGPSTRACAETCHAFASEHSLSFWLAGGGILTGWAQAACGDTEEGTARLRRGLRDWDATGSVTYKTYHLGLLAEVLAGQGRVEESARLLNEALALAGQTGEGLYEAELYRLRGELRLRGTGGPAAAEKDFRRALDLARRQEAKSLELRAAMSLTRLDRQLGRPDEARAALAEVYGRFTEGFDTPDLCEAKELLDA